MLAWTLKYAYQTMLTKPSSNVRFSNSVMVATRVRKQCHGLKHYKANNPCYSKYFKSTAKLLLLGMAQSCNRRRTKFCLGSTGDLKHLLRQREHVLRTYLPAWNPFLQLWQPNFKGSEIHLVYPVKKGHVCNKSMSALETGCSYGALKDQQQLLCRQ